MTSLSLPAPRRVVILPKVSAATAAPSTQSLATTVLKAPSYEERCRTASEAARLTPDQRKKLFLPRSLADFDDGGAFPEIHIAQYPRHMGNPHLNRKVGTVRGTQQSSSALVNIEIDKDGEISYDSLVKSGTNSDKMVYTKLDDMVGGPADLDAIALPTPEEQQAATERTALALQSLLTSHTALSKPSGSAMINAETSKNMEAKTQFIKYTPRKDAPGYNPAAAQRVIQMVPAQVDPMMPPKHKHLKAPPGPADDPVPVLHAPPKKLTTEERDAWNVPACISNWKNSRGYTIPLDKRLAADGRGLKEHTINANFATLSESLYVAEKQARQEVRLRSQVHAQLAAQEKESREEELRRLAQQARLERSGVALPDHKPVTKLPIPDDDSDEVSDDNESDGGDAQVAAKQRERFRQERKKERVKEARLENNMEAKKARMEQERDVSEKVALGVHTGAGSLGGQVDSRLYNQSAGMDSGFGAEDEYNTYSKPMFDREGVSSASIYRPTRGETEYNADEQYDKLLQGGTNKFQPDKGFAGAGSGGGPRSAPVQFEKDGTKKA